MTIRLIPVCQYCAETRPGYMCIQVLVTAMQALLVSWIEEGRQTFATRVSVLFIISTRFGEQSRHQTHFNRNAAQDRAIHIS